MISLMLEYWGILRRKFALKVRQYVLFLSDSVPTMPTRIEEENLVFSFHLVQLSQVDYRLFLSSDKSDEVVFAVLGHFGAIEPEKAAEQIITKLQETSASKTELNLHLQQLRILANLPKLSPFIEQVMDSITKYIKEEDDYFFKKGEQKGKLEGKQEAIINFLKAGVLTTKQLASFFEVSEEFVENLRKQIQ